MTSHPHPAQEKIYDFVIIGSGISGLVSAAYLARRGLSVAILEQNHQAGGCLQIFSRDKRIFDTGVHYIGGFGDDQSLMKLFDFLGIRQKLHCERMDMDGFDRIIIRQAGVEIPLAQGWERFQESLVMHFPTEGPALQAFVEKIKATVARFGPYHLQHADPTLLTAEVFTEGAWDVLNRYFNDELLKAVLGGNSILYCGKRDKTPFYAYALILNSYVEGAYRLVRGGAQLSRALTGLIRTHGGEITKRCRVKAIRKQDEGTFILEAADGRRFCAKKVISAIHPESLLQLLPEKSLRSGYRHRIEMLPNTPALMSVHFVVKPETMPYFNHNYYILETAEDAWSIRSLPDEGWPYNYMVSTGCEAPGQQWCNTVNVLAYCDFSEFAAWEGSFNTVMHPSERSKDYELFKNKLIHKIRVKLEGLFPGFSEMVNGAYCSTALTYRDYLNVPQGSPYGIEKDFNNILFTFVSPKMTIPNLYQTGQNTDLHGVYGAAVSALLTLSQLEEGKDVFDEIQQFLNTKRG